MADISHGDRNAVLEVVEEVTPVRAEPSRVFLEDCRGYVVEESYRMTAPKRLSAQLDDAAAR
jgi:hypothetical protein